MELKKPAVNYLPEEWVRLASHSMVHPQHCNKLHGSRWSSVSECLAEASLGLSLQCWQKVQLGLRSSVFSKSHTWNDQKVLLSSKKSLSILSKIWNHPDWPTITYSIFFHRINVIHVVNWILQLKFLGM